MSASGQENDSELLEVCPAGREAVGGAWHPCPGGLTAEAGGGVKEAVAVTSRLGRGQTDGPGGPFQPGESDI